MKRTEFKTKLRGLLIESIELESQSHTMFSTAVFLTTETDRLAIIAKNPKTSLKDKLIVEKQMENVAKKMEWELKFNKKLEEKAMFIEREIQRLNQLNDKGEIQDD